MHKRRRFTQEFKVEAVRLLEAGSRPASEIAREMGVPRNRLYKWQEQVRKKGVGAFPGSGRGETHDELTRVRRSWPIMPSILTGFAATRSMFPPSVTRKGRVNLLFFVSRTRILSGAGNKKKEKGEKGTFIFFIFHKFRGSTIFSFPIKKKNEVARV